jgi:hypothetical protein
MDLAAEMLATEPGLVHAARADARQVLADQRSQAPHRERLQGREHLRAARILHVAQDAQVLLDGDLVDDEAGRRQAARVEQAEAIQALPHVHGASAVLTPSLH